MHVLKRHGLDQSFSGLIMINAEFKKKSFRLPNNYDMSLDVSLQHNGNLPVLQYIRMQITALTLLICLKRI